MVINLRNYHQLIFGKELKPIPGEIKKSFQQKEMGKFDLCKPKYEIKHVSCYPHKNQLVMDKGSKSETWNHATLDKNTKKTLQHLGTGRWDSSLDETPETEAIKAKIDKWDCIALRSFCPK